MSVTPIPFRVKIDALLWLARRNHEASPLSDPIFCGICYAALLPGDKIDWDHHLRENAGGKTDHLNVRPVHHECHKEKRRVARSKATTLGKDNYEAKKTTRLVDGPKPSRRPMKSKPDAFRHPTLRRKVSGEVVAR